MQAQVSMGFFRNIAGTQNLIYILGLIISQEEEQKQIITYAVQFYSTDYTAPLLFSELSATQKAPLINPTYDHEMLECFLENEEFKKKLNFNICKNHRRHYF